MDAAKLQLSRRMNEISASDEDGLRWFNNGRKKNRLE